MSNSAILKTYDPKMVIITFGAEIIEDFADGSVIELTMEDNFESVEGADGSENRINKNRNGADCNISIMQQSTTNDRLSTLYLVDKVANTGILPLTIKDLNGTTLAYSAQSYIKKLPDLTLSNSIENRTWNFRMPQIQLFEGGNL